MLNEKKNKFFNILPFIILPILILTILIGMVYGITNSNNQIVYADESSSGGDIVYNDYSFYGNDLFYLGAYRYYAGGHWLGVDFIRFNVNFMSTYDISRSQYKTFAFINANKYGETSNSDILNSINLNAYLTNEKLLYEHFLSSGGNFVFFLRADNSNDEYPVLYYMNGDFNSNVKFIQIGSTQNYIDIYPTDPHLPLPKLSIGDIELKNVYTYVRYLDNNGNSVTFSFPASSNSTLNNRTYTVGDLEDNASYNLGVEDGKIQGKQLGYNEGKQVGLAEGEEIGFNKGYKKALADDDTGLSFDMFLNGALSILDVKIFGLFSLGSILTIIMSVTLVIFVLKMFAGG